MHFADDSHLEMLPINNFQMPASQFRNPNFEVRLFCQRLVGDWDNSAPSLRKAWNFKDAIVLHQCTGAFLHFQHLLERGFPAKLWPQAKATLTTQFLQGFMDPDLLHAMSTTVPPGDAKSIGSMRFEFCRCFQHSNLTCNQMEVCIEWTRSWILFCPCRPFFAQVEQHIRMEKEDKEAKLASNVRQAEIQQLLAKFEVDMATLASRQPTPDVAATNHALDMKYLNDRQRWPGIALFHSL